MTRGLGLLLALSASTILTAQEIDWNHISKDLSLGRFEDSDANSASTDMSFKELASDPGLFASVDTRLKAGKRLYLGKGGLVLGEDAYSLASYRTGLRVEVYLLIAESQGAYGIKDSSGTWRVAPDYSSIRLITPELYRLDTAKKSFLYSLTGKKDELFEIPLGSELEALGGDFYAVRSDKETRVVDSRLSLILAGDSYVSLNYDRGNELLTAKTDRYVTTVARHIEEKQTAREDPRANETLFTDCRVTLREGKIGFEDKKGGYSTVPTYDALGFRDDRYIEVRKGGGWGLFDTREGREAIAPSYDAVTPFSDGIAVVEKEGMLYFLNDKGEKAFAKRFYAKETAAKAASGEASPINVNNYNYLSARFKAGFAIVISDDNRYGVIDTKGNWKIAPGYTSMERVDNPTEDIVALGSASSALFDKSLKMLFSIKGSGYIGSLGFDDRFEVSLRGEDSSWLAGIMNRTGNWILKARYDSVARLGKSTGFEAEKSGKKQYFDHNGSAFAAEAMEMLGDKSLRFKSGGKFGVCDLGLKVLVRASYDDIEVFRYGDKGDFYLATLGGKSGLLSSEGKIVIPVEYESIQELDFDRLISAFEGETLTIYSTEGQLLFTGNYEALRSLASGFVEIILPGGAVAMDAKGRMVASYDKPNEDLDVLPKAYVLNPRH